MSIKAKKGKGNQEFILKSESRLSTLNCPLLEFNQATEGAYTTRSVGRKNTQKVSEHFQISLLSH